MRVRALGGLVVSGMAAWIGGACVGTPAHARMAQGPGAASAVIAGPEVRMSSNVLESLRGRVPSLQVTTQTFTGCAGVVLRGRRSFSGPREAVVYVDGQRAADSCILGQMSSDGVERVEVYPGGVTHRPGYLASPTGLILVFTRGGR